MNRPEIDAVLLTIPNERSKLAREDVVVQHVKELFVEFERPRKLLSQLPHAVEELSEHRRHLAGVDGTEEAAPVDELVPERQPLLLDEGLGTERQVDLYV